MPKSILCNYFITYNIKYMCRIIQFISVAQSCLTLWPHGLQHVRLPCPSPTPKGFSDSCPSSWWCHPTISSSVVPFSLLQPFPASGSFPMSQFFASGGQSTRVSASVSVLPMNIQNWFPLDWLVWSGRIVSPLLPPLKLTSEVLCFHIGNSAYFCSFFKNYYMLSNQELDFYDQDCCLSLRYVIMYTITCAEFLRI